MAAIETVLGPIDADQLGFTLSHEHVAMPTRGGDQPLSMAGRPRGDPRTFDP